VAVLPFFHIYAMNTIMTMGLQVENDKGFAKRLFAA
jgi:hypothetical protein